MEALQPGEWPWCCHDPACATEIEHNLADSKTNDPHCTCGSGGHPRHCAEHPRNYDKHLADINIEGVLGDMESWLGKQGCVFCGSKSGHFVVSDEIEGAVTCPIERLREAVQELRRACTDNSFSIGHRSGMSFLSSVNTVFEAFQYKDPCPPYQKCSPCGGSGQEPLVRYGTGEHMGVSGGGFCCVCDGKGSVPRPPSINPDTPSRLVARRVIASARAAHDPLDFGFGLEAKIMAALDKSNDLTFVEGFKEGFEECKNTAAGMCAVKALHCRTRMGTKRDNCEGGAYTASELKDLISKLEPSPGPKNRSRR